MVCFENVRKGFSTVAGMASPDEEHLRRGALLKSTSRRLRVPISTGLAAWEGDAQGCCNHPSRLLAGSKDHRETDSDGEADWKRSLRRSLDGKVAWRKGRRQSVFYHGGGQLVQRNRNLPDCPNEA